MRKVIINVGIIYIISTIGIACNDVDYNDLELKVYNNIFNDIVSVDYGIIPVKPPPGNRKDSLEYIAKLNAYYSMLDSVQKVLYVVDSLILLDSTSINKAYKLTKNRDEYYDAFVTNQHKSEIYKTRYFDISKLKLEEVKILPKETIGIDNQVQVDKNILVLGHVVLSRVIFNSNYDKALFVYAFFCEDKCGYGQYIIVKKENDFWTIEEKISDWII